MCVLDNEGETLSDLNIVAVLKKGGVFLRRGHAATNNPSEDATDGAEEEAAPKRKGRKALALEEKDRRAKDEALLGAFVKR